MATNLGNLAATASLNIDPFNNQQGYLKRKCVLLIER